jgi:predicted TIM-barrel fold metal-dependent hydrolase
MPINFEVAATAKNILAQKSPRVGVSNRLLHYLQQVAILASDVDVAGLRAHRGGVFERFPELKIVSAENDIAWVPHLLERADKYYRRFKQGYGTLLSLKPSEYFRRQVFATFIDDPLGLKVYSYLGADNFMWSTDYPHQAATWPHTMEVLARDFAPLPEADRRKIVRENCAQVYGFSLPG